MTTHEKKGWVTKEGGKKGSNSWKQRWMVTEDTGLAYYKKEDQKQRCGYIELKTAVAVRAADHKKKPNVFEIVCPDRIWVISCAKPHERNSWVDVISKIINELNPTKKRTMTMEPSALHRDRKITPRGGEEGSAESPISSSMKRKFRSNLRQSMTVTGNIGFEDSQDTSYSEDYARKPSGSVTLSALDSSVKAAKEKVKKVKELKSTLERTALKKHAILNGIPIGQLFVSVLAAQFDNPIDTHAKPFVEVYFERQMIESGTSKNSTNPHWKDNFRFEVASLESRIKLKIFDRVKSGGELAFVKIPIRPLEDQKQHKQWYDLQGEFPGKVHLSWRYQSKTEKKEDDTDVFMEQEEVVGTAMLTIIGARNLKDRPSTGAPPNPRVVITYGKSEYITETVQGSNNPEWNYGCILRIRNNSTTSCLIRVEDMDKVQHAHLGTVIASHEMILNSALSEEPTSRWVKLKIDTNDDLSDNQVAGELHIKYRYKPVNAMQKLVEERIEQILNPTEEMSINYDDIPEGFPEPPPKVTEFLGSTQEQYKEWMKLKLLRQSWESTLHLYRKKEKAGDTDGMANVVEQYRKERKAAVPDAKGVRRGGEVQLGTKREQLSTSHHRTPSPSPRRTPSPYREARTPGHSASSELNPFDDEGPGEMEGDGDADGATSSIEDAKPRDMSRGGGLYPPTPGGRSETPGRVSGGAQRGVDGDSGRTPSRAKPTPAKLSSPGNPFEEESSTTPQSTRMHRPTGAGSGTWTVGGTGSGAGGVARAGAGAGPTAGAGAGPTAGAGASEGNPFDDDDDDVGNPFGSPSNELDWFSSTHETSPESLHDLLYKVIIVGDSGVGKTSILWRWMSDKFQVKGATINVEFYVKSFKVNDQVIKIQLWDTAGQEQYRAVTRSYYRNARGAILVYDVTKSESFSYLISWLNDIREAPGNDQTQVLLVGNKMDLVSDREVSTEQGIQFAQTHGLSFMETSAVSGNNVDKAFRIILTDIHKLTHKQLEQTNTTNTGDVKPISGGFVLDTNTPVDTGSCCTSDFDSISNSLKSWFS